MSKHFTGPLYGRHTTAITAAEPLVRALSGRADVTRVLLGRIDHAPGGGHVRLKTATIPGGVRVTVRGPHEIQTLTVLTTNPEGVAALVPKL